MNAVINAFVTFLGTGFFPIAPGTAATAAGLVLVWALQSSLIAYSAVLLAISIVAVPACSYVERVQKSKDPGIIVIDEVIGIMVALWGIPLSWPVAIVGFFLFRAFDMFKIYPINRLERLSGGWGIVLDDVMAGVYTNIILQIAIRYAGLI